MGEVTKTFSVVDPHGPFSLPCNECGRDTQHSVASEYKESGSQDCGGGNSVDWLVRHQLVQCLGCQFVSYRKVSSNSEDWDHDEDGNVFYGESVIYFPPREAEVSKLDRFDLPLGLQDIYEETIMAIQQSQAILAAIGIRAIVEATCVDLAVPGRSLAEKIDALRDQGKVTPDGAKLLQAIRDVGNDAAHRVKRLSTQQLLLALRVVDHLLEGTYIIPPQMEKLFPVKNKD